MIETTATVMDGQIVIDTPVELPNGSRVRVAIEAGSEPAGTRTPPRERNFERLTFGMLRRQDGLGRPSTGEDFAEARRSLWKSTER